MRGIVWFKKDLRIMDNPALFNACEQCEEGVIAIYIIDVSMWKKHHTSHCQIEFILQGLCLLQKNLATINVPLLIKQIDQTAKIPEFLKELAETHVAAKLFFNTELEINEARRDLAVIQCFQKNNLKVEQYSDQVILNPLEVRTNQDGYFKVFTPFKRQWIKVFQQKDPIKLLKKPKVQPKLALAASPVPEKLAGIKSLVNLQLWPAGEKIAYKKLIDFIEKDLLIYDQVRDFPMLDATSKLSPYLAVGMISVKTCFMNALVANANQLDTGNKGVVTWLAELIWRDFYRQILVAVPRICMNKAYKIATEKLPWSYDETLLTAWQQGKTGFPIVDAAMRQLNTIGWMHNRLRMVVAMFLSKNLFLDWRLGEQYFSEHLIDFDFASNNGGWQWSASTGTDAVPYFRIFNPTSQSQRFDQQGDFIRMYCPELNEFDEKSIHDPYRYQPLLAQKTGYPRAIIDYNASRSRVLDAFKKISS